MFSILQSAMEVTYQEKHVADRLEIVTVCFGAAQYPGEDLLPPR